MKLNFLMVKNKVELKLKISYFLMKLNSLMVKNKVELELKSLVS
jgi:hypothetical protein